MIRRLLPVLGLAALALLVRPTLPDAAEAPKPINGLLGPVPIPADNPQTPEKIELGKMLYFDPRLSADNTIACAKCHDPKTGWADHDAVDIGIKGQKGTRNGGSVLESGYMKFQFWDGRAASLEEQALGPIHNPVEMGETLENVVKKLNAIPEYKKRFQQVFKTDVTTDGIAKAIASFERTVVSGPSPYDRYVKGEANALSPAALRGLALFQGKAMCIACHSGPTFSDQGFHNLGVGMDKPNPDIGREAETKNPADHGRFKTPTLRDVALTYPYMHDGSEKTLLDTVELYNKGGVKNPNLDPLMRPLNLNDEEKKDLIAFMESLSGPLPEVKLPKLPGMAAPGPKAPPAPKPPPPGAPEKTK